uniref:Phosphatidate phosphatase LPIN3 n=1 Tax=Ascaris suum TaxID=6253 RepID=F1KVC6_ASCSU
MEYAYRLIKNVRDVYNTLNPATLSGAIDLIVVEQPDGTYTSTPFHVRFGKYGCFTSNEKYVDITINGEEIDLKMKLGENGVAFFVEETEAADVPEYLVTSPLPDGGPSLDTSKVLEESARTLEEQRSRSEHRRIISGSSSISRSPSPAIRSSVDSERDKLNELERRAKKALPFNASLFSQRRNRSLPNLSELNHAKDVESSSSKREPDKLVQSARRRLAHSRSSVDNRSITPPPLFSRRKKAIVERSRKDKSQKFPAKRINNFSIAEDSDSDDAASSTSSLASGGVESGQGSASTAPKAAERDVIADGALSDSEVDRNRNAPQPHGSDVTEWKWGELPKTRNDEQAQKESKPLAKKTEEVKKEESSWSGWFRWSKPKPNEDQGIYLDDLVENSLNDPSKIEKYLGKSSSACPSPPYDSGNASATSGGPNSPQSASDTEEITQKDSSHSPEDKTPTDDDPKSIGVEKTGRQSDLIEHPSSAGSISSHPPPPPSHQPGEDSNDRERQQSGRSNSPTSDIFKMSDEEAEALPASTSQGGATEPARTYIRSLRLSSEKLKQLPLKRGTNEARFSITTKFQGTCWCSCHIYLYRWSEQIVISDIDGTITKSDVLGHVIPAIGGQWAHAGVAELYTRIAQNGYKMVYLSSRAIGQSYYTKKYLQSIAQHTRVLPDGPLLLSPTSVLMAFRREVIDRKPEEFKIAALSDLKECFPVKQPFYAGFGNRDTDITAYRAVDIPLDRILIINKEGRVRRADSIGFETSYMSLALDIVDYMFPPLVVQRTYHHLTVEDSTRGKKIYRLKQSFSKPKEYSEFTHWRSKPEQSITLQEDELANYEKKRKISAQRKKADSKK